MPNIGVTGHRVLAEIPRLERGVDEALDRIEGLFPEGPINVLSSLAEGADRLAVRRALARRRIDTLIGFVPMFLDKDFEDTFSSEASVAEFRALKERAALVLPVDAPEGGSDPDAYDAVNEEMLLRTDVLLAVWDGRPARGPGGTASMVERARECGLPMAWVHAGNRRSGADESTTLGGEQGTVTYERFG